MAKRENAVVSHVFTTETGRLVFTVTGDGAGTFEFDVWKFAGGEGRFKKLPVNAQLAFVHGIVQKVSDRAAIGRDPDTGASASPAEKFEAMKEVSERIATNEENSWNAIREGGENGGLLYRAMKALYPNAFGNRKAFSEYLTRVSEERKQSVEKSRKDLTAAKAVREKMEELRVKGDASLGEDILSGLGVPQV